MIGAIAAVMRPDLFTKLVMIAASPRYLNDSDYYGGFEQEDLEQLFEAIRSNYKAWCSGFAPLAVGGDMDSVIGMVTVPCHILQSVKDLAVPVVVTEYLHQNLGGESIVEVMSSDGHLPQLSSPDIVIPVLLRHIRHDIAV
ncbi:hypothetical protein ACLB2K_003753 [Fragaria x ananassa]